MESNNMKHLSIGEPTYWASGRNKLPDVVDFCVTKDIPQGFTAVKSCFNQSSNLSPALITIIADLLNKEKEPSLSNKLTNWDDFRRLVNGRLTSNIPLKTEEDIEAAARFFKDTMGRLECNARI
jgi:hypothetical protein